MTTQDQAAVVEETGEETTQMTQPIIIDLGKKRSKAIKAMKRGEGKLWDEVLDVVEEVKEMLDEDVDGKVIVPVVLVFEKKPKRQRLNKKLFPLMR
jgi:hypothetical protein